MKAEKKKKKRKQKMEQTEQVNKIKLITTDVSSFIPFFWILKRNRQEVTTIREMLNVPIYLWNIDRVLDYKFSLHFLVYLSKYLTEPSCCGTPDENPYTLGWVSNIMMQKIEQFNAFMARHRNEVLKIEKYLDGMQSSLDGFTTMYSKLNTIPTEMATSTEFTCLTCGVGKRSHCRYCMHHNIILLEILHRPECWRCYTPCIYISNKIRTNFNTIYVFTINTSEKNVTLGWQVIPQSSVGVKTRAQVRLHFENERRSRPLFLDWGTIELFKQCSRRERVPTLRNMMLMYIIQNYEKWDPTEIPEHLVRDLDELKYVIKRFTHM